MKEQVKKKAFNIVMSLNDYDMKDFENKKSYELSEDNLIRLNELLDKCNTIIKKEG